MNITAQEIIADMKAKGLNLEINGEASVRVTQIAALEDAKPGTLVFLDKKDLLEQLVAKKPAVIVTSKGIASTIQNSDITFLIAPYVPLAHAWIKQKYGARDYSNSGWESKVHASSVVHESVEIGRGVTIEPRAVIGQNVKIADDVRVMAGVVIENDAVIGARTVLAPSCVVGYNCKIGSDVLIGSGTVIGSEGYGFAQDASRKSHAIPQTGNVVIEDHVRVGANCCIDRAAYRETRIGAGTKIDNLCHIAHNVEIGQDCLLTSMLCIAGSSKIGNRVMTSGQTGISDHVSVCDDAVLLHRAGVTKDIETPGAYGGLPTQPLGDYMKNSAVMRNAVELRKRVSELEEKVGLKT